MERFFYLEFPEYLTEGLAVTSFIGPTPVIKWSGGLKFNGHTAAMLVEMAMRDRREAAMSGK